MTKTFQVCNISWDAEKDKMQTLPQTMTVTVTSDDVEDLSDDLEIGDYISDYLSDMTGYCHFGFQFEEI